MPSRERSKSSRPKPAAAVRAAEDDYQRLIAFLDFASGFNLAYARCNLPLARQETIRRAVGEAARRGITVKCVDVSRESHGDFLASLREQIGDGTPSARFALMVTGIDPLIYHRAGRERPRSESVPPFVARLNFQREQLAREFPFPLVLWLESESLKVLLRDAPDLSRWVSAQFDFGGPAVEEPAFARLFEGYERLPQQTGEEIRADLADFRGLLEELGETRRARGLLARRKRLAVLEALAERHFMVSNYARAKQYSHQALKLAEGLKDQRAVARNLGNLGLAYAALGEPRRAIEFYEQRLVIAREIGDRRGEGQDLGNLGNAYAALGEPRRAIEFYEQALAIAREIGDRRGEGNALGNLGIAYAALGEPRRAIEFYEQSLAIAHKIGDRRGEGQDLGNLGNAYADLGEPRRAIEFYQQQLAITREIGDRRGEANALFNMSLALDKLGDRAQVIAHAEAALKISEQIEDPYAAQVRQQLARWRKK